MPPDEIRVVKVEPRTEPRSFMAFHLFFFFSFLRVGRVGFLTWSVYYIGFYEDAKILFVMYTCMILIIC